MTKKRNSSSDGQPSPKMPHVSNSEDEKEKSTEEKPSTSSAAADNRATGADNAATATDNRSKAVEDPNLMNFSDDEDFPPLQSKPKTEKENEQMQTDFIFVEEDDNPITATVFVAAPESLKHIAVTGQDMNLGNWKKPRGKFLPFRKLENGFCIFKGTVPVPAVEKSAFKFVVPREDRKSILDYEGKTQLDNRYEKLLPDSWHFFIVKEGDRSWFGKLSDFFTGNKREKIHKEIITWYLYFAIIEAQNKEASFEDRLGFLLECFTKIWKVSNVDKKSCWDDAVNFCFLNTPKPTMDKLFWLLVSPTLDGTDNIPRIVKDFAMENQDNFSLYLDEVLKKEVLRVHLSKFHGILRKFVQQTGLPFWWLLFRVEDTKGSPIQKVLTKHAEVREAVFHAAQSYPQVLFDDENTANDVVKFLVDSNQDHDALFEKFQPFLGPYPKYEELFYRGFARSMLSQRKNFDDSVRILQSKFLAKYYEDFVLKGPSKRFSDFSKFVEEVFSIRSFSDAVRLLFSSPSFLEKFAAETVLAILQTRGRNFYAIDAEFNKLAEIADDHKMQKYAEVRDKLLALLLNHAQRHVEKGALHNIPSVKLLLMAVEKIPNLEFLQTPCFRDLRKVLNAAPDGFFNSFQQKMTAHQMRQEMRKNRTGSLRDIVSRIEVHIDTVGELVDKARKRKVLLFEIPALLDPKVSQYLKSAGLLQGHLTTIRANIGLLRNTHQTLAEVVAKFGRLGETQVLDPKDWEGYLTSINVDNCQVESCESTLAEIMDFDCPISLASATWLLSVSSCDLFWAQVWRPLVESLLELPVNPSEFHNIIEDAAGQWKSLADKVSSGSLTFAQMEAMESLDRDRNKLADNHLRGEKVTGIAEVYRDYRSLHDIRHTIAPFVAALRYFKIRDPQPINALYDFVRTYMLQHWDRTTVKDVRKTSLMEILYQRLRVDPDRPESKSTVEFISSLVRKIDEDMFEAPLLEWLSQKKDKDMQAMDRILQGNLRVAYGMLQTLNTRIAPFLNREFATYEDLLTAITESERNFAQGTGRRLEAIRPEYLASMLPEIEAALKAAVISPQEDAKAKLKEMTGFSIAVEDTRLVLKVMPKNLSLEELQQAYQLLEMAAGDEGTGQDDPIIAAARRVVPQIFRLFTVAQDLFVAGWMLYRLSSFNVRLDNLEDEIRILEVHLEDWLNHWKKMGEMPLLAIFPRDYLLFLADRILHGDSTQAVAIVKVFLPQATNQVEASVAEIVEKFTKKCKPGEWLITQELFDIFSAIHEVIQDSSQQEELQLKLPTFLEQYGRVLNSHFCDKAVQIFNVPRELVSGSAIAAFLAVRRSYVDPSRILFITRHTTAEEVTRFMVLWATADATRDFFIVAHIERLSAASASAVRDAVVRILPERRAKLLLLAQHQHQVHVTKSIGARLGLTSDRVLETNFVASQLREAFKTLLPCSATVRFFISELPGCGKTQQVLQSAALHEKQTNQSAYYRVPVRSASVEELLSSLKTKKAQNKSVFLHLDVAQCASPEFNDIILSLLIRGALFDPLRPKLGFWTLTDETRIAVEFASPLNAKQFPIIDFLGELVNCQCRPETFTYDLAEVPRFAGSRINFSTAEHLAAAANFLELRSSGPNGIVLWDRMCAEPETCFVEQVDPARAFDLFLVGFQSDENRAAPTFTAINCLALFIYRHISAMMGSVWFNQDAGILFDGNAQHAAVFKTNIFELLCKVANDTVARSLSIRKAMRGSCETRVEDWTRRQRAVLLLGLDEQGNVLGVNIIGRDEAALKAMFHKDLIQVLEHQGLRFQQLSGFGNLLSSTSGTELVVNAMRALLLLDGTEQSLNKVRLLDAQDRRIAAADRLEILTGPDRGYVLTGDNLTKMMFALYRVRCGLPVIAFGEAGVGKSALFRFLFQTLLGHRFEVCNVNSGTTIDNVSKLVDEAVEHVAENPGAEVFLFFDEMNTADPPVIAMLKELMLDGHYNGCLLPKNVHLLAAANPYRYQTNEDKEAAVGLVFRFTKNADLPTEDMNKLVYRVNPLPLAMYDHVYDFGHLCDESEATYIHEICRHFLKELRCTSEAVQTFAQTVIKSHRVTRALSSDPPSAVSLRDATRAATLFRWFRQSVPGKMMASSDRTAEQLGIYLAYAFRFMDRKVFLENVFGNNSALKAVSEASTKITKILYKEAHGASIGAGAVALNEALCENLFALFVCVLNGIFVIIVGRPGTSKSLSVEILKLVLSAGNHTLRQKLGGLPAVSELYFQCSPLSTSAGFRALFNSAQRLSTDPKLMLAMVVLDELGLADLSPEKPIKILHAELERQAILTSGEVQRSPFSVVALSNWVVDAAQVNRGILVRRQIASDKDLVQTAKDLTQSLLKDHAGDKDPQEVLKNLEKYLWIICRIYDSLDKNKEIGGGHFYSMRDFFFCVKNFVCSVLSKHERAAKHSLITDKHIIKSVIRNFGGHEKAVQDARMLVTESLDMPEGALAKFSPVDLILENIRDSEKQMSVHIARHLMILNKSMIGLQLLNRHVRNQLESNVGWHVLFGPCFPGDLHIMSVTRKLRQVEQAIRAGGVLILCHADQLFESLYMVLNQQYWAQGNVNMTQIALGPSTRTIALPDGPFRIIALQDTHRALNRSLTSPAILSRFEKHELNAKHLLKETGTEILDIIGQHSIWLTFSDVIGRQKLLYGYHEDSFPSLALHVQQYRELDELLGDVEYIWMKALNPMEMLRLENVHGHNPQVQEACKRFRDEFARVDISDLLSRETSTRLVVMTNTLRHVEVSYDVPCHVIRLFDLQTEMELHNCLEAAARFDDENFHIIIHHDTITGAIQQFQFAKYEVDKRFQNSKSRVLFIVHVDPRPANINWVFSFGDGWDYVFVDDIVPVAQTESLRLPLDNLLHTTNDERSLADYISTMKEDVFKTLLLEIIGPSMQLKLGNLGASLGHFFSGVRSSLGLCGNSRMLQLLQKCLVAQLESRNMKWNATDAVNDEHFDASSSLSEALWSVFKNKMVLPLAHLLLVSDVWRICDETKMKLWCDFIEANYPDRLLGVQVDGPVQMPIGFRLSTQPFGRLLVSLEDPLRNQNSPLCWLLNRLKETEDIDMMAGYFRDWLLLKTPPHLHSCVQQLPLDTMRNVVEDFFYDTDSFLQEWVLEKSGVIAALELVNIAQFAKQAPIEWGIRGIGSLKRLKQAAAQGSLEELSRLMNSRLSRVLQSVTSIEISLPLRQLLEETEDQSNQWLALRIAKRMLLFDGNSSFKMTALQRTTGDKLIGYVTQFVMETVIAPKFTAKSTTRQNQRELFKLLELTGKCRSPAELVEALVLCPKTKMYLQLQDIRGSDHCPSCREVFGGQQLTAAAESTEEVPNQQDAIPKHCRNPSMKEMQDLFQKHQHFLFFFERVAEIFVEQFQQKETQLRSFLLKLVDDSTHLRVSWRFLTVIVRAVLASEPGVTVMNEILANMPCNAPHELTPNGRSLLQALLYCADEDMRKVGVEENRNEDPLAAAMTFHWTVDRIRQVASIRQYLSTSTKDAAVRAVNSWARWNKNIQNQTQNVSDALLFFILRFVSGEGDETRIGQLLHDPQLDEEIREHPVIGPYFELLSPHALGFPLLPDGGRVRELEELLSLNKPMTGRRYQMLQETAPERAPYLARLALHVMHIAQSRNIGILRAVSTSSRSTTHSYLPGIVQHPFLDSYNLEPNRWYVCPCGYPNVIGNCGHLVVESVCSSCNNRLAIGYNAPAPNVRLANVADFPPPKGFFTECEPTTSPSYSVRNANPLVTRFSMLLTSLAMIAGILEQNITSQGSVDILRTLPRVEQKPQHRGSRSLLEILSRHVLVHLDVFCDLFFRTNRKQTVPDQFRLFHLLLHKLLDYDNPALSVNAAVYETSPQARGNLEAALGHLLERVQGRTLLEDLQKFQEQGSEITKLFQKKMKDNEKIFWAYERHVSSDRRSVQLLFARDPDLKKNYPFTDLLLDETVWGPKLDALQHFGDAFRFVALVRTVLQRNISQEDALRLSIDDGLQRITEHVAAKPVILDRGRSVSSQDHVLELYEAVEKLWGRFSQLPNREGKTFLDHFECQQVNLQIRPCSTLTRRAPLILVLAGAGVPEAAFVTQLLNHALEAAVSVALMDFVQPHCRKGSGRVKLSCSSASSIAEFDESLYSRVTLEQVDNFLTNHAIDMGTLPLAESFASAAVLGAAGSTIAEDLILEPIPEFVFKNSEENDNYLLQVEKEFLAWQPVNLTPHLRDLILADLERNRILQEGRSILLSVLHHVLRSTEPLYISTVRSRQVCDIIQDLLEAKIIAKRHVSDSTMAAFSSHLKLEVCHVLGLLKSISTRMRGDDIFGGRVPDGWNTKLSPVLVEETRAKLRGQGIVDSLLHLAGIVNGTDTIPAELEPKKSLLAALRMTEGQDFDGVPAQLRMEHLGHVLIIAESLANN